MKPPLAASRTTENDWVALRPIGTEPLYRLYAESFVYSERLHQAPIYGVRR
jgi:phosphoglucomutase